MYTYLCPPIDIYTHICVSVFVCDYLGSSVISITCVDNGGFKGRGKNRGRIVKGLGEKGTFEVRRRTVKSNKIFYKHIYHSMSYMTKREIR